MTFGGAPCPALWSCLSEPICDVANDLIQCELWDHKILHSSNQYLITSPERLSNQIPFKAAQELDVDLPINDKGIVDILIDDNIPVCPDFGDNAARAAASVPLALHVIG